MAVSILSFPPTIAAVRNPIPIRLAADQGWAAYNSYYVSISLAVAPVAASSYTPVPISLRFYPAPDGTIELSLHRILEAFVGHVRPATWLGAGIVPQSLDNAWCLRYRWQVTDYGDGLALGTSSNYFGRVFNAGLRYQEPVDALYQHIREGKFLTRQPRTKLVHPYQREWLSWAPITSGTYQIRYQITDPDGIQDSVQNGPAVTIVTAPQPNTFATSLQALDGSAPESGTRWQVWVENATSDRVSEIMTYEATTIWSDQERWYLFRNSFGGYDTLRTVGDLEQSLAVSRVEAQVYQRPAYDRSRGQFSVADVRSYGAYEQATGLMPNEATVQWLRDLLTSVDVYRVGDHGPRREDAGNLTPILLEAATTDLFLDNDFRYAMSFSYREAFDDTL